MKIKHRLKMSKYIKFTMFLVLLVILVFFMIFTHKEIKGIKQKESLGDKTEPILIEKVGNIVSLPNEETPIVTKLTQDAINKNGQFFINAKEGDYLLLYVKRQQGIIYRESSNKVVNMGVVKIDRK